MICKNIHFLYEYEYEKEYFQKLANDKVIFYPLRNRITYKNILEYANNNLENKLSIYLHADMHITKDFNKLNKFNKDDIYMLTSHDPIKCNKNLKCNCTRQFNTPKGIYGVTFDGFIFLPKIDDKILANLDYEVNHMGAENKLIYELKKESYNVICPNKDIRAIHQHKTIFHNRKDWISIVIHINPWNFIVKFIRIKKSYENKIVGGGIPFYLGSSKFIDL